MANAEEEPTGTRPRVSVVICVLNGERFVETICEYTMKQTFKDIEVLLIVSDKSVDRTLEASEEMAAKMPRATVYKYRDVGELGGSKNHGLEHAKGDFLWFLDVDDEPSLHYLEELVGIADAEGADIVGCNFRYSTVRTPPEEDDRKYKVCSMTGVEAAKLRATERYPVASWSMLYSRKMVLENGIRFEEGICEDISFTYKSLLHAKKVCFCYKPLYKYMITPGSVCNDKKNKDRRGLTELVRYDNLERYIDGFPEETFFRNRFALLRIRSSGHLTFLTFCRYVCGEDHRQMLKRTPGAMAVLEGLFQRMFPPVYYLMMRTWFKLVFYRSGRSYVPV